MYYTKALLLFCLFTLQFLHANSQCTATVKSGSTGECVKVVQRTVGVADDGIFGPDTEKAVRQFQTRNNLEADGIVGKKTWDVINSGGSGSNGGGNSNNCGCSYDNAGTTCSGGPTKGTLKLKNYMQNKFSQAKGGEIYNCRNIRGGSAKSLHAEGRALDFYPSTNSVGDQAFDHAISIACKNGIQEVIYNRQIWTSGRGNHPYNGVNPHTDHVHIGLNRCGAEKFNL